MQWQTGTMSSSQKMSDAERQELIAEMDKDLEDFIAEKSQLKDAKREPDPWQNMTVDEIADELLSHPAFMKEIDYSKPLSPEVEALMALKYDVDDAEDKAENYKCDGNENFRLKKYRWAVASYTEGIKVKAANKDLNAILYTNRAAANFHVGNYGTSYKDCVVALRFKPDHMKAIVRAAQCSMQLCKYDNAIKWVDVGLKLKPDDASLLETRRIADKQKRQQERDHRKEEAKRRKETDDEKKLLAAIQERGVTLAGVKPGQELDIAGSGALTSLEAPGVQSPQVKMNENGSLIWPVVFLYPEYQETDFIQSFHEDVTFEEQIASMFGPECDTAPWDREKKYIADNLLVYYEDRKAGTLHSVKRSSSLSELLKRKNYTVHGGTPGIILLVKDSPFAATFLNRYK